MPHHRLASIFSLFFCLWALVLATPALADTNMSIPSGKKSDEAPGKAGFSTVPDYKWFFGAKLVMQNEWTHGEPNLAALGPGLYFGRHLFEEGGFSFGVEGSATTLFREGGSVIPCELSMVIRVETHSMIEPYISVGPVYSLEFGARENAKYYGGLMAFGMYFHTGHHVGMFVEATYRLLWSASDPFQQQMAFALGPAFFF